MSAFQIFGGLVSLALIGFAITVIEHARAVLRDERASKAARTASRRLAAGSLGEMPPGRLRD